MKKGARINRLLPLDQFCIQTKDFDQITDDFVERKRTAIEANLKKGESAESKEGASASKKCVTENMVRILEEGELPEDVQMPTATSSNLDIIKKAKPLDFDEFTRKRKVALLIAYCGGGYHGMQKNPDVDTIESKLLEALVDIKAVRPQHKDDYLIKNMNTICFQRAARTDKGVSAARQVVSLKVVATESFIEDMNKILPKDIRVFGMERVTKKFDAKCSCSGRSYEYLVPSFAFAQSKTIIDSGYRLPGFQLEKIKSILGRYVGTHNFHNFTSGKKYTDKSAYRYITKFTAGAPFICRGHEFIALEVSGQSFMIHQIRKMIGLCIAICRTYCSMGILERCFNAGKLDIPKAPGLGLLLNRVSFAQYNRKYASEGERNPLTFDSCELQVERYKIDHIWHSIIEEEIKKSSLVTWLKTLSNHTYNESGMTTVGMTPPGQTAQGRHKNDHARRPHGGGPPPTPAGQLPDNVDRPEASRLPTPSVQLPRNIHHPQGIRPPNIAVQVPNNVHSSQGGLPTVVHFPNIIPSPLGGRLPTNVHILPAQFPNNVHLPQGGRQPSPVFVIPAQFPINAHRPQGPLLSNPVTPPNRPM